MLAAEARLRGRGLPAEQASAGPANRREDPVAG